MVGQHAIVPAILLIYGTQAVEEVVTGFVTN